MLSGTNTTCQKCVNDCKQWSQIKVIICPMFKDKRRKNGEVKNPV